MQVGYPKFDEFSLNDDNYIMSEIVYRTIPTRQIESDKILRRPGVKILSAEFAQRKVSLRGSIVADTVDDLRTKIDNLHTNVTRKTNGLLFVESDRSANAIVDSIAIGDPFYSQTYVPIEIDFLLADPFFYGLQQVVNFTVVSGTTVMNQTITVSGSIFAEPTIMYNAPAGSGYTTTSGIRIDYLNTAENITWSGTLGNTTLAYGDLVQFDYINELCLEGIVPVYMQGVFSRWEPGEQNFTVTFSGSAVGGTLQFIYQPRYL